MLKKKQLIALASIGILLGCSQQLRADNPTRQDNSMQTPTNPTDKSDQIDMKKLSEAFGHFLGRNLKAPGFKFDMDSLIQGIREGAAGAPPPLSEKEYEEMMTAVQERAFKEMSGTNLNAANEFFNKNRNTSGVVEVVPGKLQYIVLKEGNGEVVTDNSSPKINYTGKYHDGTVFSTSEELGGPITIPLNQTIPGFSKGIVGMKEGEKRRLFVHPDLGYGTTGQLPPNEMLVFEVEVVKANSDESKDQAGDDEDFYLDEEEEGGKQPAAPSQQPNQPSKPGQQGQPGQPNMQQRQMQR